MTDPDVPWRVLPVTGTFGARIEGLDLTRIDDDAAELLRTTLRDHHVVVLPPQELDDDQHTALAAVFGEPRPHPVAEFMGSREVVAYVTNDADHPPTDDSDFHSDYTFNHEIAAVAVLQAQVVPTTGGDTVWCDVHAAHDALSPTMQSFLATLDAHHTLGPRFADVMRTRYGDDAARAVVERFEGAVHPMVVHHPETGRSALFVNPGYTDHVVGLHAKESAALLAFLFDHLNAPRFHLRHHWQVGEIAIWDEVATVHQGAEDFWPQTRTLRRITGGMLTPARRDDLVAAR